MPSMRIVSRRITEEMPPLHGAIYTESEGLCLVGRGCISEDNDRTWLPSYRWFSVSNDGGDTWTEPEPWTYDDGDPFFSPSSMSTLFRHSCGRVFWIGNMSDRNCNGNSPRWPVVIGEVDPKSLTLMRRSVLEVDTRRPEDEDRGRLDLSHFCLLEDQETGEIVVTYPRAYNGYRSQEGAMVRIAIQ